jgi:hypothetical protein
LRPDLSSEQRNQQHDPAAASERLSYRKNLHRETVPGELLKTLENHHSIDSSAKNIRFSPFAACAADTSTFNFLLGPRTSRQ